MQGRRGSLCVGEDSSLRIGGDNPGPPIAGDSGLRIGDDSGLRIGDDSGLRIDDDSGLRIDEDSAPRIAPSHFAEGSGLPEYRSPFSGTGCPGGSGRRESAFAKQKKLSREYSGTAF